MGGDETRAAQAESPVALALCHMLADPSSTLRRLLRVSDIFCVRLTCKEAWICIQYRPLTKLGVLTAATDLRRFNHHVPLLRWCLRNGITGFYTERWHFQTIGETGDAELVSEVVKCEPKPAEMKLLLYGLARAGRDELARRLLTDFADLVDDSFSLLRVEDGVATGGCLLSAAAIDDNSRAWGGCLHPLLVNGHLPFVEWVLADVEPGQFTTGRHFIAYAAQSGSLELVKWLYRSVRGWRARDALRCFFRQR
jgi:hypothetical protein